MSELILFKSDSKPVDSIIITRLNSNFIPLSLKKANDFVLQFHRHNKPVVGHKFSIGLLKDDSLIGVGIVGRPIARKLDNSMTLEILRVCVAPYYKNANSMIYSHIKRISLLFGYTKLITYTLQSECGSSLSAIHAKPVSFFKGREWNCPSRPRQYQDVNSEDKIRWEIYNNEPTNSI